MTPDYPRSDLLPFVAEIVAAYASSHQVAPDDLPGLLIVVYHALSNVTNPSAPNERRPAVAIKHSICKNYLVCLDDGKRLKSLKRHIAILGMTPDQYRARWGLPDDYPMVAPEYAARRSDIAKKGGLGQRRPLLEASAAPSVQRIPEGLSGLKKRRRSN